MFRLFSFSALAVLTASCGVSAETAGAAQAGSSSDDAVVLPAVIVTSPRVANQEPQGTFAMPVSALRFEPLVDVQGRNSGEAQADVSIRGGTFENTGFSVGASPLYDPQTGHYSAEIPVSPYLLTAPVVRTGTGQALGGWGATAGSVAYGWRPIRTGGVVSAGAGEDSLWRGEVYSGFSRALDSDGTRTLGVDASVAGSSSDGAVKFGDHDFERYNVRAQYASAETQTDVFAGYQAKIFGWPNLYTAPTAVRNETENLKTRLFAVNHRVNFGADGDHLELGATHRRNSDFYDFNRLTPDPVPPFQHETKTSTVAASGRSTLWSAAASTVAVGYRAGVVTDEIDSARLSVTGGGLGNGRYDDRTQAYAGVFPEFARELADGRKLVVTAGATLDYSNREDSAVSPLAEIAVEQDAGALRRMALGYARTTQLPTYTALNSGPGLFGGNRALGRAFADTIDLKTGWAAAGWTADAGVFYRRDRDLVDWTYSNALPNTRTANAVDIDTYGVELVASRTWSKLEFVLGYTWLTKQESYGNAAVDASFYALNFPEHRVTAAVIFRPVSAVELRVDNEFRVQEENALRRGDQNAFFTTVGIGWRVPSVRGLTLTAQVENLWDVEFEEVPGVRGSPRQASVGAIYAW